MEKQDDLQDRLGDTIRQGMAAQARAYREYGALLDRLASRDIKAVQFARDSADLYIETMGRFATSGVKLAEDAMKAGLKGVGVAVSSTAEAVEKGVDTANAEAGTGKRGKTTGRRKRAAKSSPAGPDKA